MSEKQRFFGEFEINSSPNILFPFISGLDGLQRWYAEEANYISDEVSDLIWDSEHHYVKLQSARKNNSVVMEFLSDDKKAVENPNVLKLNIEKNELTSVVYLMVEDYTDLVDTDKEFQDIWGSLVDDLKDILGA